MSSSDMVSFRRGLSSEHPAYDGRVATTRAARRWRRRRRGTSPRSSTARSWIPTSGARCTELGAVSAPQLGYAVVELELRGGRPSAPRSCGGPDAARGARRPWAAKRRAAAAPRPRALLHVRAPRASGGRGAGGARGGPARQPAVGDAPRARADTRGVGAPHVPRLRRGATGRRAASTSTSGTAAGLADELTALADRLDRFVQSMTYRGEPATPDERASWVEALGWFAGWSCPARGAPRAVARRADSAADRADLPVRPVRGPGRDRHDQGDVDEGRRRRRLDVRARSGTP